MLPSRSIRAMAISAGVGMGGEQLAASVGGVCVGRAGERDMVVAAGFDDEVDGDFIEKSRWSALGAEVGADGENQLIRAG